MEVLKRAGLIVLVLVAIAALAVLAVIDVLHRVAYGAR